MLNGKRIELTQEQIETLVGKKEKDPFDVRPGDDYYSINGTGVVQYDHYSEGCIVTKARLDNANACTDAELMRQRALHETLNRLLWRYSMQHGGREIGTVEGVWKGAIEHFHSTNEYRAYTMSSDMVVPGEVYFIDRETAEAAIEEIVKPFMEKHPEFRW